MQQNHVGIVGTGIYLPKGVMSAREISEQTKGVWAEEAVREKLGINQKLIPQDPVMDGTQEMGALAALDCLKNTGVDPREIDVILCIGEEWKEYPLTTSALYIQDRIGAINAWGIDVQNRCCTCVSAMKIARDMMMADDEVNTVLVVGSYLAGDFVDYTDQDMSMMYNLGAGGEAICLKEPGQKPAAGQPHHLRPVPSPDSRRADGRHGGAHHLRKTWRRPERSSSCLSRRR